MPVLTDYVANFVSHFDEKLIPLDVEALAKKAILDALGVSLSGSVSEPTRVLVGYLEDLNCQGPSSVFGSALRLPPRFAALANGTSIHADDYDDTLQAETGRFQGIHPTAPVLAALLAAGEPRGISGRDLLTAYQVGVETACRLFDATHVNHILHGFHATGTCGMLGATAAVSRLYGLSTQATSVALGIAASQAGGLQENFGTMVKPFHAGRSAECGIVSNDLQCKGFTASAIILEAKRGFFQALGGGFEEQRLLNKLGNPWSFVDRGIWLKPYPTGSLGHPAMTAMEKLVRTHNIVPKDVKKINLKTSKNIHHTLLHHRPQTELEAKFSLEFCLAALLLDRQCGLNQFTDEYVQQEDIQNIISLINYTGFTAEEELQNHHTIVTSYVEIILHNNQSFSLRADFGKGNKADPMTESEIADKFRECADFAKWDQVKTEKAISLIQNLENVADVRELTACLTF